MVLNNSKTNKVRMETIKYTLDENIVTTCQYMWDTTKVIF